MSGVTVAVHLYCFSNESSQVCIHSSVMDVDSSYDSWRKQFVHAHRMDEVDEMQYGKNDVNSG